MRPSAGYLLLVVACDDLLFSSARSPTITRLTLKTREPLAFLYVERSDGIVGIGQMGRSQMDSVGVLDDDDLVASAFFRHVAPLAVGADVGSAVYVGECMWGMCRVHEGYGMC